MGLFVFLEEVIGSYSARRVHFFRTPRPTKIFLHIGQREAAAQGQFQAGAHTFKDGLDRGAFLGQANEALLCWVAEVS